MRSPLLSLWHWLEQTLLFGLVLGLLAGGSYLFISHPEWGEWRSAQSLLQHNTLALAKPIWQLPPATAKHYPPLPHFKTAWGKPTINLQQRLADLAYEAHQDHLPTPANLGSYGCAAAVWHYILRQALAESFPAKAKRLPQQVSHTQQILNLVRAQRLGHITTVSARQLTPEKTPPGSLIVGFKKGNHDQHMLVAVDVDWQWVKNPKNPKQKVFTAKDGKADAYAGNTGLKQYGAPHFRIQEFAPHLGFLNKHHGAINSNSPNNYYDYFMVIRLDQNA
jgi:hypothetical protein